MKWFSKQNQGRGLRARLMQSSGAAAVKLFEVVAGEELVKETVAFFEAFYGMREGFQRAPLVRRRRCCVHRHQLRARQLGRRTHLADAEASQPGSQQRGRDRRGRVQP